MIKLCGEYMSHRETKDVQEQKEFIISSFATLFYRVSRDIESLGGTPDFSTMVVMFHKPEDFENIPGVLRGDREITLGIKMYGEFDEEEKNERKTGGEIGGQENRGAGALQRPV